MARWYVHTYVIKCFNAVIFDIIAILQENIPIKGKGVKERERKKKETGKREGKGTKRKETGKRKGKRKGKR